MKANVLDVLVVVFLFAVSLVFFLKSRGVKGRYVIVETPSCTYCYSLFDDGSHTFDGAVGKFVIKIENGTVRVVESYCNGKNCMGYDISRGGQSIVCLPNKITISLSAEVDDVAY